MTKNPPVDAVMTPNWVDDSSTTCGGTSKSNPSDELKERVAFLKGKIEAQAELYITQLSELRAEKEEVIKEKSLLVGEVEKLKFDLEDARRQRDALKNTVEERKEVALNEKHLLVGEVEQLKADLHESRQESNMPKQINNNEAVWKGSATVVAVGDGNFTDMLNSPPFSSGIHKWSIRVDTASGLRLGVVSSASQTEDCREQLGGGKTNWGYGGFGDAWHNNLKIGQFPSYDSGSVVKFILDLTDGEYLSATLSAAVDGRPAIQLFSTMKSYVDEGFIPAAFLYNDSRIEFLGFE